MAKHIMCDLETLGTGPNAAVLSVALVVFDDDDKMFQTVDSYYGKTNKKTITGDIDAGTVMWWMEQSDAARSELRTDSSTSPEYKVARDVSEFLRDHSDALLWGNGASFDNVILRSLLKRHNLEWPIKYSNDRCYRTVKAMFPQVPKPEFRGTQHNAWDDAVNQAEHLYAILQHLRGGAA
jgi:exodeoxyribonuclease VIII